MSGLDHQILILLKATGKSMQGIIRSSDGVKKALITNSMGAAASSLAAGFLPGVGALAATAASVGFIWRMYIQINEALHISISKNKLKSLASALLSNLVTGLGGAAAIEVSAAALSLVPGIGIFSASVLLSAVNYALVYVAGLVYIRMLTNLFHANADISAMSEDQIKVTASNIFEQNKKEFKNAFDEARKSATKDIKAGKIDKSHIVTVEKEL